MEKMTESELKLLRELQAKQKRAQRAEADFLKEADDRKEVLLERWGVTDKLSEAATIIGTTSEELYAWITSDEQVGYYRRRHGISEISFGEN